MNMLDTEKEYYSTELNKAQIMVAKCFKLLSKASEISRASYIMLFKYWITFKHSRL